MASFEQAVETYKKSQGMKQDMIQWWPGFMGDGVGNVNTANEQMCLVRYPFADSPAIPVLDLTGVARVDGLAVKVGYLPWSPGNLQIISVDDQRINPSNPNDTAVAPGTTTGYVPNSAPHSINHSLFGVDPDFIDMAQVTNLSVQPSSLGGMNVQLFPGYLPRPGVDAVINPQTLDLTAYVPVSGALYALLSYDATGAIVVTPGPGGASFAAIAGNPAYIPDTPAGNFRIGAVALYAGQTAIVRSTTENDFWDLRYPQEAPASVPAGHTIEDEGTPLTQRTNLNFIGPGVTATDDSGNDATVVTISGLPLPTPIIANPHAGNVIDETVARAVVDGRVYWSSHRAQGASTALGYEYAYNFLAATNAEIQNEAGKALWQAVYNATDGLIYAVGQAYHDSITYRAIIETIDPTTDTVTTHILNASGEATGDCNELIAILDDGTQIVAGERVGGGVTTGSDFPNGGGLWTIPKATIGTVSTYTRVYEDGHSPTWEWSHLAKVGSTYFNFLKPYSGGKYLIQHSTNLTAWTDDVDGSALALSNDIRGAMAHHKRRNYLYAVTANASRQVVLHIYNGSAWSAVTFLNLALPSSGAVDLKLAEFGDDLIMIVSRTGAAAHDIYLIARLDGTPDFALLFTGLTGTTGYSPLVSVGPDCYYGTNYPGALWHLHLWGQSAASGTVSSIATGTGLTGGPITTTGTISDANTGVAAATYGDASNIPQIAVNAQGRITSASNIAISTFTPINVYNETQTGDGTTTVFYLMNLAAPGTIRVWIDGIRQPASDDTDPTDVVSFSVAPALNALLLFDYEMDQI